jgi:hypothetical protein
MSDRGPDHPEKPPISIWKNFLAAGALFVFVMIVLGIVQHYWQRTRDGDALERVMAELDESDPSWRLEEIERARPSIPDERNSATVVLAASGLLPAGLFKNTALSRLLNSEAPQLLDAKQIRPLQEELTAANASVIEARKLADLPTGRYPPEYYRVSAVTMEHIRAAGRVGTLLRLEALHLAQIGKPREALHSCPAMFNAARSLDDEPYIVSQTARCNQVNRAAAAVERTLALSVPASKDLADLQELVEEEESHPGLLLGHRGNRAAAYVRLDGLIKGVFRVEDTLSDRDPKYGWRVKYARWTIRDGIRRGLPQLLELHNRAVEITRLPLHQQAVAEKDLTADIVLLAGKFPFFSQSWPSTEHFGSQFREKVAYLRCLTTLLALERYRQAKGTWPARLDELMPKLLKAMPLDPFDGKPLRYKKLADGVIVYSVGTDGIDDGGKINPPTKPGPPPRRDLGLRLWNVKHRRQQPPPGKAP